VAGPAVSLIESLGIDALHMPKHIAQVAVMIKQREVDVIRHEVIGNEVATTSLARCRQNPQEAMPVLVIGIDRKLVVATRRDVMKAAGWVDS